MTFRFVIFNCNDFNIFGTDDEEQARLWAEGELVYDTQTGLALNADGSGVYKPLEEAPVLDDESEE